MTPGGPGPGVPPQSRVRRREPPCGQCERAGEVALYMGTTLVSRDGAVKRRSSWPANARRSDDRIARPLRPRARTRRPTDGAVASASRRGATRARCTAPVSAAFVGPVGFRAAPAPQRLSVARRTTLHAAAGMVDPAERGAAVAAFFRLVTVPWARFLAPADRGVGLPVDGDRVGQAADPLGHLAAAVRTNGHDPPLLSPVARSSQPQVAAARMARRRRRCAALRFGHDDCER